MYIARNTVLAVVRRALCAALFFTATAVFADGAQDLQVSHAWIRATPPGAPVGAAYFSLHNRGTHPIRVVGIQTKLAQSAEIHQSFTQNGREQMRPVTEGLAVAPGQSVDLKPGSYHVMLMGLDHPLVAGTAGVMTLLLDDGSRLDTSVPVLDARAMSASSSLSPRLLYIAGWINLLAAAVVLAAVNVFGRHWPEVLRQLWGA